MAEFVVQAINCSVISSPKLIKGKSWHPTYPTIRSHTALHHCRIHQNSAELRRTRASSKRILGWVMLTVLICATKSQYLQFVSDLLRKDPIQCTCQVTARAAASEFEPCWEKSKHRPSACYPGHTSCLRINSRINGISAFLGCFQLLSLCLEGGHNPNVSQVGDGRRLAIVKVKES